MPPSCFRIAFALVWLAGIFLRAAEEPLAPFLSEHCLECHDSDTAKGDIDLEILDGDPALSAEFPIWEKVHDMIASGEMPPEKKPRPAEPEKSAVLAHLRTALVAADSARQAREVRVPLRRLNRTEYEYTLRDLLSLPRLEVRAMLPADGADHGFDNVSSALDLSYIQLRRYLDAADVALTAATDLTPPPPASTGRYLALDEGRFKNSIKNGKEAVRIGDAVGLLRQPNSAQAQWWFDRFRPPADGLYTLRVKAFGFLWDKGKPAPPDRPHVISLYAVFGGTVRNLATFDAPTFGDPGVVEATVALKRGDQIEVAFESLDDRNKGPKIGLEDYTAPGVAIEWLEAEGPHPDPEDAAHPSASYRTLFGDLPIAEWKEDSGLARPALPIVVQGNGKRVRFEPDKNAVPYHVVPDGEPKAVARGLLLRFMERAFRRPVPESEVDRYLPLVAAKLDQKLCFQEAMRPGFKAILCSPDFIFLQEGAPGGPIDSHAIAARLSYFLWRSMPDEELLTLAKNDPAALRDPAVLHAQVGRMLADKKSTRFVDDFTGQWLELRDLTITQPDEQLYPEFNVLIQDAMPLETRAYFRAMLERDLGVAHLIDSDFAFLNAPLADLYGIPDVSGVAIREVALPVDSVRGGLLTQASILKITANGTTTSPVVRGVWLIDRLFGKPAPPPPPGVPAIEPDIRGTKTIRDQLTEHSSDTKCARCHANIDPPGFALESFDPIGGFRDHYRSLGEGKSSIRIVHDKPVRYKEGLPVDATGLMADGKKFQDMDSFREILLADQRQLAKNLAERLVTFSTGAGVTFADRPEIDRILDSCKESNYGLRSLIHAVVQSQLFHKK